MNCQPSTNIIPAYCIPFGVLAKLPNLPELLNLFLNPDIVCIIQISGGWCCASTSTVFVPPVHKSSELFGPSFAYYAMRFGIVCLMLFALPLLYSPLERNLNLSTSAYLPSFNFYFFLAIFFHGANLCLCP